MQREIIKLSFSFDSLEKSKYNLGCTCLVIFKLNEHLPNIGFCFELKEIEHGSLVGSISAWFCPEINPCTVHNSFVECSVLIKEEQVISNWRKNGHQILVNCLHEALPGTLCCPEMTSTVYCGCKSTNQTKKSSKDKTELA